MTLATSSFFYFLLLSLATLALSAQNVSAHQACRPGSFSLPSTFLPGASIIDLKISKINNRDYEDSRHYKGGKADATCEVVVSYIYPATNSSQIDVTVWLPDNWNERFMGNGGGGWQTTLGPTMMLLPNYDGFATAQTNGGLVGAPFDTTYTLLSPGNPNKAAIESLGYRAIHEMTVIGKEVVKVYYGKPAKTNIYQGCSTGGRQGLMEASKYPEDYDGIVAGAPAVRWNDFVIGALANQAVMVENNYFPSPCELSAITESALKACDGKDGMADGVLARPDLCKFHASSVVGKEYKDVCEGKGGVKKVTATGAKIMQQFVEGIYATDGEKVTTGFPWGATVWSPLSHGSTKVDEKTDQRTFDPFVLSRQWVDDLLFDGLSSLDFASLTVDKVQALSKESKLKYDYAMEPQPDWNAFRKRGGKILTFHGIEDQVIPVYNSLYEYAHVQEKMFPRVTSTESIGKMHDFWRLFLLPGVQHCSPEPGKVGPKSTTAYRQVLRWVEEGVAPDRLESHESSPTYSNMCLYPSKPHWVDGQLQCQSGLSTWDAYPSASEVATQFFERLPSWLYLEQSKKAEL
ncbi:hypothetical protein CBS101457_003561 [Exobasidium rhododendri]|nr:hypothetical protein CBS101457_003561 [Exobasidium rhododendri]